MSFVFPGFLWASALIAIPIIIHLFNFRRYKTVYFTNVRFLKDVKEETTSTSRLKHLLVLLMRILTVLFLVFAFAQPFIPVNEGQITQEGTRVVSIYVDNSYSMNAKADDQSLLNKAKSKAEEIAKAYSDNDKFLLVTNDFEARHQLVLSKSEFLGYLNEVSPSPQVRTLSEIQTLQNRLIIDQGAENKLAFWLSDFQSNIVDFEEDTIVQLSLVPIQPVKQQNVFIDSCWLAQPLVYVNQTTRLMVKLHNFGSEPVDDQTLSLTLNGQRKGVTNFEIAPNDTAIIAMDFAVQEEGWQQAELSIVDEQITFDDTYNLAFRATDQVNVMAINEEEPSKYLKALYQLDRFAFTERQVNRMEQSDYSLMNNYALIVLNNLAEIPSGLAAALQSYLNTGGSVLVFPNEQISNESYNKFFNSVNTAPFRQVSNNEKSVTFIDTDHPIFDEVFAEVVNNLALPNSKLHYLTGTQTKSNAQKILGFRDGMSFISSYDYKAGKVFVCTSPLGIDYTDLPAHALFAPMLYNMAILGGKVQRVAYTIGKDNVVEVDYLLANKDAQYRLKNADIEFIPEQKVISSKSVIYLNDKNLRAGLYEILSDENTTAGWVALNYNRKESYLEYLNAEELSANYVENGLNVIDEVDQNFTELVQEFDRGIVLWKLCIILALIFIAAEILLLRFVFKKKAI